MSAVKNFAASTGLQPFSINLVSFTVALTIAALVIAKLINAFLFCGFNADMYLDLPIGAILFSGTCFMPLVGLAINGRPKTKRDNSGCNCRMFAIGVIVAWLFDATFFGALVRPFVFLLVYYSHDPDIVERYRQRAGPHFFQGLPYSSNIPVDDRIDQLNVCGNRTYENVRDQFSNMMPLYSFLQRIDLVGKLLVGLGWIVAAFFALAAFVCLMRMLKEEEDRQRLEDSEAGNLGDSDETVVWVEGEETGQECSTVAELETIDESSGQPSTTDESDFESALAGGNSKS